jgi:serine/threonine protein kinase
MILVSSKGVIHGDLKPQNIMRIDGHMVLIDLDASAEINLGYSGLKYSSAYLPPEMLYKSFKSNEIKVKSYVVKPTNRRFSKIPGVRMSKLSRESSIYQNSLHSQNQYSLAADTFDMSQSNHSYDASYSSSHNGLNCDINNPIHCEPTDRSTNHSGTGLMRGNNHGNITISNHTTPMEYECVLAYPAHDVWSFGMVLYELCSGTSFFRQDQDGKYDSWTDELSN